MKLRVLFIVGPTAAGKSQIALAAARALRGEIISADSMLVYKGMDIGTAKPSKQERKKIPHHLIDLFSPARNFSVFEYRKRALKKIEAIADRGKLPIVAGGSGLYIRALLRGFSEPYKTDLKVRRKLEHKLKQRGLESLAADLRRIDPERAARIDSKNSRRVLRALETALQSKKETRKPLGEEKSLEMLGFRPVVIGITKDRPLLYADIERRVDAMFRRGLVREVRRLAKLKISRTARQAVGYKEVFPLIKGECSLADAKTLVKKNTRHLAKRQWTWFKRETGISWVSWEPGDRVADMASKVLKIAGNSI